MTVEDRHTVVHLCADGIGNLLPLAREDKELHGLATGVHHIVEHIVLHRHYTEAKHHLMGTLQISTKLWEEHTGADDTEVGSDKHITQRDVRVELIDRCGDDIRTSCGAVVSEDGSQGNTRQHTADNHRHEVLPLTHELEWQAVILFRQKILGKQQHKVKGEDGKYRLHQEFHTQNLQGYHQQDAVDDDVGILQMEACGVVDDGRETSHATCHNLIGHQEDSEGNGIDGETKGYKHIIPGLGQNHFVL